MPKLILKLLALGDILSRTLVADDGIALAHGATIHREPHLSAVLTVDLHFEISYPALLRHQPLVLGSTRRIHIDLGLHVGDVGHELFRRIEAIHAGHGRV